jgi:hypothetical protein
VALALLGVVIWRASVRAPAAFQSPADARFVIGAGFEPRAIFAWLALRTAARLVVSFVLILVLLEVLYLPSLGIGGEHALLFVLGMASYGVMVFGARLLTFNLARRKPGFPAGGVGALLAVFGVAAVGASLAQTLNLMRLPQAINHLTLELPPGSWMVSAFGGDWIALITLAAIAVVFTAAGIVLAGDSYPELWAASSQVFVIRRALMRSGGTSGLTGALSRGRAVRRAASSSSGSRVPGGPWTLLWKEWLTARRGRGGASLQIALLLGSLIVGFAVGIALSRGSVAAGIVASNAALLMVIWGLAGSVNLGRDLASPLWWLSASPLWQRLFVWTLARALRVAVPMVVLLEAILVAYGQDRWAIAVVPAAPLLFCFMTQGVALASYALLPARSDYRLAIMLRMFALYATLLTLAVAAAPGLLLRNPGVMIALPSVVVIAVIAASIAFAAWRIEGNGLMFAREERQ